jgi:hypothetical protein
VNKKTMQRALIKTSRPQPGPSADRDKAVESAVDSGRHDTDRHDTNFEQLVLTAPLSGHLVPIEAVPDPVFAQKMVGDGLSLDPVTQSLVSPCDGKIAQIHSAGAGPR